MIHSRWSCLSPCTATRPRSPLAKDLHQDFPCALGSLPQLRNKSLPCKYTSLSITLQIISFISDKYHNTDLLGHPPLPPSYPAKVGAGLPMPPPSWGRPRQPLGGGFERGKTLGKTFGEVSPRQHLRTAFVTLSVSRIPRGQKRSYRERTCALGKSVLVTYVR